METKIRSFSGKSKRPRHLAIATEDDPTSEPATRDLPEGESFTNADAAAIGLRLMREKSRLPIVEADYDSDL